MANAMLRVLLVEDDEDYHLLLRSLLAGAEQAQFAVDWAPSYDDGLQALEQQRHDVYVLDHRLGSQTGLELLERAVERGCGAPMIMLTGAANPETAVAAMKAGAADYLVKGNIDGQLLERTILHVLQSKRAADAEREADLRFRAAFADAPTGMALVEISASGLGRLLDANPALCALAERPHRELLEGTIFALFEPGQESDFVRGLLQGQRSDGASELRLVRSSGDRGWVSLHVSLITDSRGTPLQAVVQVVDISDRKEHEAYLHQLAGQDPLTGLLNRRRFHVRLEECLARSARYGDFGAVLLLDLDGFKEVKRDLGQPAGEELLRSVAEVLRQRVRSTDVLAKLGGAEFAAVLMEADEDAAVGVARELVDAVRAGAVGSSLSDLGPVTVSVGIAPFGTGSALEADTLLVEADRALYHAKGLGGFSVASIDRVWVADAA